MRMVSKFSFNNAVSTTNFKHMTFHEASFGIASPELTASCVAINKIRAKAKAHASLGKNQGCN